jgi:hypothetical protein
LKELGHRIIGIDSSPSLAAAAREFDSSMDLSLADAAALPLDDALCRCKISTGCPPPFEKQRAFWNQAENFAWR